jgi:RNA polymerase sigma-70 factor, ECF subfamily
VNPDPAGVEIGSRARVVVMDSAHSGQPIIREPRNARPTEADFRALYDRESAFMWKTLRHLGVATADLEDVCAEVFVSVHRHLAEYDPTRPMRAWLFGFAAHAAADHRKAVRRRRIVLDDSVEPSDTMPSPEELYEGAERKQWVHAALDAMDFDRRAVFVAAEIDGLSMPEIVATLGIPLNTGYSRLRLAREDFTSAVRRLRARSGG